MKLLSFFVPLLFLILGSSGYRILGIFPFSAKSHFMMFENLMKTLAKNGHKVDVISPFPLKKSFPNYTDVVVLPKPRELVNNFTYKDMREMLSSRVVRTVVDMGGSQVCPMIGHPDIVKIVKNPPKDPPYDAVIIEIFGAHCFALIGHLLKVPVIGASSSSLYPWGNSIVANPDNLAFVPNNLLSLPNEMDFWSRVYNVVHTVFNKVYFNYFTTDQDDIIREHFGDGLPGVRELERSISMILANSHTSINGNRPMTPALVEVGGLHVQEDGLELPKSLEKWMNESTHGFVYFTFGSMILIESFPQEYLKIFYSSLGKLAPVRVLMKVPNPSLLPPGLPSNIYTQAWMPQVKVLKHPNIKAFITHGGLMGTQEAIHCGVPLVGIPLFADQFTNIDIYVMKNIAVKLDLDSLTEEKMDAALNAVLKNPIYRETMKKVSQKFLDRPLSPAYATNYWVEYIIRNGPDALRSPAMDLTWWQIELLDVYLFLLLVSIAILAILYVSMKSLMSLVQNDKSSKVSRAKKFS